MQLSSSYQLIRKRDDSQRMDWSIDKSRLRIQMKPSTYLDHETIAFKMFGETKGKLSLAGRNN